MDAAAETFRRSILSAATALYALGTGRRGVDLSAFDALATDGARRLAAEKAARALVAAGIERRDSLRPFDAAAVLRLVPRSRVALAA